MKKLHIKQLNFLLLALVLVLFVVGNLFFLRLTDTYNLKLDVTDQKLYALSEDTLRVLDNLPQTHVLVFANEEDYPLVTREVLREYQANCDNLEVQYVDPYQNPTLVDQYSQMGYTIAPNDIVVESQTRQKHSTLEDMFQWNSDKTQMQSVKAEQLLTGALLYVNQTEVPTASFVTGHNEAPSKALQAVFTANNYEIQDITLSVMDIQDTDVLVIASPSRDYQPNEIEKIRTYLAQGGKVMAFLEPSVADFTNLEALLAEWQVQLGQDVVVEPKAYMMNNPLYLVPMYMPHAINQYFSENKFFMVVPQARSLEIVGENGAISTKALLNSSSTSYAKTNLQYSTLEQEPTDLAGPFALATLSEKQVVTTEGEQTAMVFVLGSKNFYGDDLMGVDSYANGSFLTETLSYMVDTTISVNIPAKSLGAPPLPMTTAMATVFAVIFAAVLPIGILAYGVLVLRRRKKA